MMRAWVLLVVASIGIGIATCGPIPNDFRDVKITVLERQPSCAVDGNPDFYGLGIRIGIYLQWITAFFSNHLLREAIDSNLVTNTIFLLALFVATAVATANDTVQTSELVVLLHLCFGFLFSILSIWGHRTGTANKSEKKIRFPLMGSFFRLTLATALSAYGVWFWFVGRPFHQPAGDCASYTFLFARIDIAGGVRYFFVIQSCLILAVYAILFARELLMILSFSCFVCIQTIFIAALAVWFGSSAIIAEREDRRMQLTLVMNGEMTSEETNKLRRNSQLQNILWDFPFLIKRWLVLSLAMGWKQANGKESAGSNRPHLEFYMIPLIDAWVFLFRTLVEFWCLVLFKRCPKIDFMPLTPHPLWKKATKPETKWNKFIKQLQGQYDSKYTQQFIYISNFTCIIWTIISVELTLLWNGIQGVYTLDSTGQLIPFIIGVVGFLSLVHGVSVERSKLNSTEVILKVFDVDNLPEDTPSRPLLSRTTEEEPKEESFPLNETQQTVFWIREPHERLGPNRVKNKRRHSIDGIYPWHIQNDVPGKHNDVKTSWNQYHLKNLDDYRALRESCARGNIEIYSPKNHKIKNFCIVKDFRKCENKTSYKYSSTTASTETSVISLRRHSLEVRSHSQQDLRVGQSPSNCHTNSRSRFQDSFRGRRVGSDHNSCSDSRSRSRRRGRSRSRSRSRYRSRTRTSRQYSEPRSVYSGPNTRSEQSCSRTRHEKRRRGFVSSVWKRSKILAMILFLVILIGLCFSLFKQPILMPIGCLRRICGRRFKFAAQELKTRMVIRRSRLFVTTSNNVPDKMAENDDHEDPVNKRNPSIPRVARAEAKLISNPHRRKNDSLWNINFTRFKAAFRSRSLSTLITEVTGIANDLLPKANMPRTAHYVSQISIFIDEVRKVRKRKTDGEIGLTAQHEILAEHWLRSMGTDVTETVLEELDKKWKDTEERRAEDLIARQGVENDNVKVEEISSRRFSWPDTRIRR